MNANSTFSIGKDHIICEDYSLAYTGPTITYAIVSDGCSASPEVDFGARCLAMSAKRELRLNPSVLDFDGKKAIVNAQRVIDIFPYLSPQFLDATLLVAAIVDKHLVIYMYGDGVMVHRKKDSVVAVHVQLSSGAPDYLSYQLDPMRMQAYMALEDNKKEIIIREGTKESSRDDYGPFNPFIYDTAIVNEGDVIAVISDGINSFRKADNTAIPWTDLIDEFTAYKTTEGEFVLRRIAAFKRKCLKEGTTHSDDISCAAIVV